MENTVLLLDLVEWVAQQPRPYQQVMEAWRSTCPRLTIWEYAVHAGLVKLTPGEDSTTWVRVTGQGKAFLKENERGDRFPSQAVGEPVQSLPVSS